jgi:hypothetical protein
MKYSNQNKIPSLKLKICDSAHRREEKVELSPEYP